MMRIVTALFFSALVASAEFVAIVGEDGTTRIVPVPASGTNWVDCIGVDSARNIVTNEAVWARRHEARDGAGTIEWADGARSHFRIPKPGNTVAVSHEIKVLGKGSKRTKLVEVLWIDHEGKTVSNAIGRAAQILPFRPTFDKAVKEREDRALAAAKRRPEPDAEDRTYISSYSRRRPRGKGIKPAKMQRQSKPAASKRESPDEGEEKVLEEYRAKAKEKPSHVEKRPGR